MNQRVENLLAQMTIDEKLEQMTQVAAFFFGIESDVDLTGPLADLNLDQRHVSGIGSTLNYFGADNLKKFQDEYMARHRLGIPMLFMADVIHGYRTVFPIPLALGCSFNPSHYETATKIAAKECSASGIHLTFAPMSDLVRDPRWGRVMESPGEDPYLNSLMTAAAVRGFQGDDPKEPGRIAACVKHFAGYGASEGGRDYNWVDLSHHTLCQYYLQSYKAAVDAGVKMVMTAFNVIDGIPSSANKMLFRDILREQWGFDGVTISDYAAIDETIINGYVRDGRMAAKACLEAGIDIEMMSAHYINYGKELVECGALDLKFIDEAVRRILTLKDDLGLFENPYKDADASQEEVLHKCQAHLDEAYRVATECAVLLKNEGVLPLAQSMKIGIAGPFASSSDTMGGWSLKDKKNAGTLGDVLSGYGMDVKVAMDEMLKPMQDGYFDVKDDVSKAVEAFKDRDAVIVMVGEHPVDTGESASRTSIRLSPHQEKLITELGQLGIPVIAILFSGRPLEIAPILPYCQGVLQAWFLGTQSSLALADLITGRVNPSARLSMSFPQTVGQIPVHYNSYNTGRPNNGKRQRYVSCYLDCDNEPLYPFGYGLSYGETELEVVEVKATSEEINVSATITNPSSYTIKETIQLYIRDCYASVVRPIKELKRFEQVVLMPGETRELNFKLTKEDLMFYNDQMNYVFEAGEFEVMLGKNSRDVIRTTVTVED